jgi:hypothetical protein
LFVEENAHGTNKNIEGFYTKPTQALHKILATFNINKNSILTSRVPLSYQIIIAVFK